MSPPDGVDILKYGETVLTRFANPELGHRTPAGRHGRHAEAAAAAAVGAQLRRVAPQFATLIAAAWAEYARAGRRRPVPLDDPLAARVRADLSTEALFGAGRRAAGARPGAARDDRRPGAASLPSTAPLPSVRTACGDGPEGGGMTAGASAR